MAYGPYRDGFFGWGAQKVARESRNITAKAYLYYFDHPMEWAERKGIFAAHGFELPFTFNNIERNVKPSKNWPDLKPRRSDIRMASIMSDYWVAFAKRGMPADKELPEWPAYTEQSRAYMAFRNGRAEPGENLLPGSFELHEKIIRSRRARGDRHWNLVNIGLLAPVINPQPVITP